MTQLKWVDSDLVLIWFISRGFSFRGTRVIKDAQEKKMELKETFEKIEKDNGSNSLIREESFEKEVCWDKPFTLSGGCCQD